MALAARCTNGSVVTEVGGPMSTGGSGDTDAGAHMQVLAWSCVQVAACLIRHGGSGVTEAMPKAGLSICELTQQTPDSLCTCIVGPSAAAGLKA